MVQPPQKRGDKSQSNAFSRGALALRSPWLLALLLFLPTSLCAPIDTEPAQINVWLRNPGQTNTIEARFQGTVVYTEPPSLICVQTGKAGVSIKLPVGAKLPALGDHVLIETPVRFASTEAEKILSAATLQILSTGSLPEPTTPWLLDALNGEYSGRYIQVDGVVMQTRRENDKLLIHLTDKSGWAVLTVYNWRDDVSTSDWWGARLRVRAVNFGRGLDGIRVQSPGQIQVVDRGVSELFQAPVRTASQLRSLPAATPERFRLRATVLEADAEEVFLRDGETAFRASYLRPYSPGSAVPHANELLPPSIPPLAPGDLVEVVGSPLQVAPSLNMSFCAFRVLGKNEPLEPATVPPRQIISGAAAHNLVRVSGKLVGRERATVNDLVTDILKVEAEGIIIQAHFDSSRGGQLTAINPEDRVELTGLVMPNQGQPPFIVRLLHGTDAQVVDIAPRRARERTLRIAGLAVALLLAAGGWIAFLRNRLADRERTARAIQKLNVALEQRVRERTQELEVAKEELRRTLSEERELHELKSRFISMVSHEFRTPLAIIMSSAEILDAYLDRLSPEDRQTNIKDIFQATRHMGAMVEDVLLLSRFEAGKLTFRPARFDVTALCSRLVDEVASATNERCLLKFQTQGHLPLAFGDEALLRHIFTNLLQNAVKYSPPGAAVTFELSANGEQALFTVQDYGIGIPEADARQLFTAFHRGRNVGDTPGTGLGMMIVKSCVDLHRGSISFNTAEGQGTTFYVRLPLFEGIDVAHPSEGPCRSHTNQPSGLLQTA